MDEERRHHAEIHSSAFCGDNPEKATTSASNGNESSSGSEEPTVEKPSVTEQKPAKEEQQAKEPAKPSKLKQLWTESGLDAQTLKMMFKGSIPPTVAIAVYQAPQVQQTYQTLGYLVAISSVLGFCIMPRGKFIQSMSLNVLAVCFAAAINLLALYCVTQARKHTTPAGQPPIGYNSSASAVCAIWLMFEIYVINCIRAARPQFQFPMIINSIFVIVSLTYGTQFPDMSYAISFMKRLLEAFLTGFALATAAHFFIFPFSSRMVVFKELTGYIQLMSGILQTQTAYMATLETYDPLKPKAEADAEDGAHGRKHSKKSKDIPKPIPYMWATAPAIKMRELMGKLLELHTKLHGDVTPAKREIAIGKLESHDLTELWKLTRSIFLPVLGLASMMNILERQAELLGWKSGLKPSKEEDEDRHQHVNMVHQSMKFLHKPFAQMTVTLGGGFQHVLLVLELVPSPKKSKQQDEESNGDRSPAPGEAGFAEAYKNKVEEFYGSKKKSLEDFCAECGIDLPEDFWDSSFVHPKALSMEEEHAYELHQRQLFFVLYLEYLLWRAGKALLALILFVDKRKQEGAFKKSKLIFPGSKTLYKWLRATFGREDFSQEDSFTADMDTGGSESLALGENWRKTRDPEHMPPRNGVEKFGEALRGIPKFFRSDASAFGFRVVAATMTLGVVCYLHASQTFFLDNRLLWAMIMTAISMNRTAGQSVFNFVLRVFGTAVAMIAAYIMWYIVDGKTGGVLVFLWLGIFISFYPILKMPKFIIVAILGMITSILIIGYELQVRAIGVKAATSNGQPAYPTYILAPYRLATVAGGVLVAFIWTVFPFPISESTELRKDLATSLHLMGAYYENVHQGVRAKVSGRGGSREKKGTAAYALEKARMNIFSKLTFIIQTLKTNSGFSKFQVRIGGRFPREEYDELIGCINRLLLWVSLGSYASQDFELTKDADRERSIWLSEFRKVIENSGPTSSQISSLLSLLAASLGHGQPLPPYLEMPKSFEFVKKMQKVDPDIVSVRHIAEPEYSAFAVMQVTTQCINTDIRKLTKHVKNLVGEIDFSLEAFSGPSTSDISADGPDEQKSKEE